MRVLLDTNVLVSAAIKPDGKPAKGFQQAAAGYELLCTEHILQELADGLARGHIQKKYKDLVTAERRDQFIALVRSLALMVEVQTILDVVTDEKDNQVLAGAVDGRAGCLVTGDPHLLALKEFQGCRIITPDQFLGVLQGEA